MHYNPIILIGGILSSMIRSFTQFHPVVRTLLIGTLFTALFRSMCYPFLTILLGTRTHLPVDAIGILIGIGALSSTIGAFVGGTLSDRFGRGRLMLLSLLISSVQYVGFTVFSNAYALAALLIVGGFFGSFFDPVSRALTSDLTASEMRPGMHSIRYLTANAGYGIGPLLGLWIGLVGGTTPFLFLSGLFVVFSVLLAWLFHRYKGDLVSSHAEASIVNKAIKSFSMKAAFSILTKDYALLMIVLGGVFTTTIEGLWSVSMAAYLPQQFSNGEAILAALLTINAVMVVLAQTFLMRFTERKNPLRLVVWGSLLFAAAEVGFAFSNSPFAFWAFMVVFTLGEVLILPSQYALIDNITPPAMNGTYYGAFALNGFGNFLGPWLSTLLLGRWGGEAMFVVFAAIALISILFYMAGARSRRGSSSSLPQTVSQN